jgi:hypothetical protein
MQIDRAAGAGALNIWAVALESHEWVLANIGGGLPGLDLLWEPGTEVSTAYRHFTRRVFVNGSTTDPDEWDDGRIAHEFGHAAMKRYGYDDSPGGEHFPYNFAVPPLAWSEGFAHWFACTSQHTSYYTNVGPSALRWRTSFEALPAEVPRGTAGNVLGGDISEMIVGGTLLDLSDGKDETYDTVEQRDGTIWSIMRNDLGEDSPILTDRGAAGRDLVDFLDAWVRTGAGDVGVTDDDGLRGILTRLHGLTAYDFSPP